MADSKLTALSEISVPILSDLGYTVDDPGGSPISNKVTHQRLLGLVPSIPGGRLTLTTAVPITTADVTGVGTLYYTPYVHNGVRVFDGTRWLFKTFSEISLALTLTSGKNYDVFIDDDAATLTLSSAWTDDTTRADALGTQDSIVVLNSDKTKLWLGVIRASAANVTTDSAVNRLVGNAYNTARRLLSKVAGSSSHTYNSSTWRNYNADATQRIGVVHAVAGIADLSPQAIFSSCSGTGSTRISIGLDSSTVPSVQQLVAAGETLPPYIPPWGALAITAGYHYLQLIESVDAGTSTFDWGSMTGTIFN
jgi:hypothetical protein